MATFAPLLPSKTQHYRKQVHHIISIDGIKRALEPIIGSKEEEPETKITCYIHQE